ncbi:MAG: nucleoside deaminase [Catalinimonas sp.]
MVEPFTSEYFMTEALKEARAAGVAGEVPVGAVVVSRGRIIARGRNQTERLHDVTAHAELLALTAAAHHLGAKYLPACHLYVTLEPCVMCAGALAWAQLGAVTWGADDAKRGFRRHGPLLHPKTRTEGGLLADEAGALLRDFFRARR